MHIAIFCTKGDPFQGWRVGSCLTLRNELFEETHMLTKQETLLGNINQILTVVTSGKGDHGHCIQTITLSGRRGDKGAAATGDL